MKALYNDTVPRLRGFILSKGVDTHGSIFYWRVCTPYFLHTLYKLYVLSEFPMIVQSKRCENKKFKTNDYIFHGLYREIYPSNLYLRVHK